MVTAIAHPNIALIKYWGKQNEELIIPATSSISLTLEAYKTTTTVSLAPNQDKDTAVLNGKELTGLELQRITQFLTHIRHLAGKTSAARIISTNTVPTAAGLASSASGFAALALAAVKAYGLELTHKEISKIARRGSGSATRSLFGGIVIWNAGNSDASSYANQLEWNGEELEMIIAEISSQKKAISSRKAMQITTATSPFYEGWVSANSLLVEQAIEAVSVGNLKELGKLTELSTLRMHAVMMAANPPIRYLTPLSWMVIDTVQALQNMGLNAFATADAGPNIKILTTAKDCHSVLTKLKQKFSEIKFLRSKVGGPARIID